MIPLITLERCQGDFAEILQKWQTYLSTEKNVSKHTLRAYCSDMARFIDFLSQHQSEAISINSLSAASITDFRSWLSNQANEGASTQTRARALSSVKNFLVWMDKQGIAHNAAIHTVRAPKLPRKLPARWNKRKPFAYSMI